MEFQDYRASTLDQLPAFCENYEGAVDHFWKDMASVTSVMNSEVYRFRKLSKFSHILLVLPYTNADVEHLFSMVRKIETKERSQLDQSTVCDLLTVKINNDNPCYSIQELINDNMLSMAKSATIKYVKKN